MRVFNLTDVATDKLSKEKLVNTPIVIGRHLIAPGKSIEVEDTPALRLAASKYVQLGCAAVDTLPHAYLRAKELRK